MLPKISPTSGSQFAWLIIHDRCNDVVIVNKCTWPRSRPNMAAIYIADSFDTVINSIIEHEKETSFPYVWDEGRKFTDDGVYAFSHKRRPFLIKILIIMFDVISQFDKYSRTSPIQYDKRISPYIDTMNKE